MIAKTGVDLNKNYLDIEIYQQREDYIKNVNIKGTLEYKLNEKFKHMNLSQFLNHISNK